MTPKTRELLRSLPSVSHLLEHEEVTEWLHGLPRSTVVGSLQAAVDSVRAAMTAGEIREPVDEQEILARAEEELLSRSLPSIRRVINATGIVLHTGLGRAPLSDAAIEALVEGASGYCNLEYELHTGRRGKRNVHVAELLTSITGAEAATVVNNNAAATLLILRTLAANREVVVSRGQLIEIGGSYRLPEIMQASGAILREVGTTNRTRATDYERAITDRTALLMRVHPSNYRVVGFTESTPLDQIVTIAHRYGLIAVDDLGSGALFDLTPYGLPPEPCVRDSLAAGADLVCFSGDKLLGGPQCGVILGRREFIERIESSPLMRTYRLGKLTFLSLEATLRSYLDPNEAFQAIPNLAMMRASTDELAERARKLGEQLEAALPEEQFYVCSDVGYVGGGSMPGQELETVVVRWRPSRLSVEEMAGRLREGEAPVVVRVRDDAICFDLRTLREPDFEHLVSSVSAAVWGNDAEPSVEGPAPPVT